MKKWISKNYTGLLLLLIGLLFLLFGIWRKELADIWRKAVQICMECIGIG